MEEAIVKTLINIIKSSRKISIEGENGDWVHLAEFGAAIRKNGIKIGNYGYSKLSKFAEEIGLFQVFTDTTIEPPVKYIRLLEDGEPRRELAISHQAGKSQSDSLSLLKFEDSPAVIKVKKFLRLKNNCFIGQFRPDYASGGYKIVDIRNTDFTKIEDPERNIRNLEISFQSQRIKFRKFSYYMFVWRLVRTEPLQFEIDLRYEPTILSPEDIINSIAHSFETYSMDAARKIKRSLETLSKQLTQSGKEVFIYELLQNANDYPKKQKTENGESAIPVDVEFHIIDDFLTFQHTGEYFNAKNVAAICSTNDGEKNSNVEAIGYKGIGFKTVFLDSDYVFLQTGTYTFRFDKKSGTSDEVPINTPWQIYPFWTSPEDVSDSIKRIFDKHPNDEYRVKFALKPRNGNILHDRARKDNYVDLFTKVFDTERVILFIPNIHQVSVFFGDTDIPAITRSKDNDSWCVSDAMTDNVPDKIRDRINEVLTNNDADKSDGYDKIPEKYLNFNKTAVRFACKKEGRRLLPVEDAILYCYLPAKRANWGFDFLMNTDMVPNGARDDIEDIELNHEIAKIAGKQFFYWIKSLIESGEYDADSIFSLIPNFKECKERHSDYKEFIEEFQEEFEKLIVDKQFIPVVNSKGEACQSTIETIVNDLTHITRNGVIDDTQFLSLMGLSDYYLPIQELRESDNFMSFLYRYSPSSLDIDFENIKKRCSDETFEAWLKNVDNNNRFVDHLLENDKLELFADESIFIEYEGDLFSADSLYYDFENHCNTIQFLWRFIPHMSESSKSHFDGNEEWNTFVEEHFLEFKASDMLDDYVFSSDEAIEQLKEINNSINFFKFVADNGIDLSDRTEKLTYFDENGEVCNSFNGLLFFFSDEAFNLSKESWLGENEITILSHEYLDDDTDNEIKGVFTKLGFIDYDEKDFILNNIVGNPSFCQKVNSAITGDFDKNVAFVKFVYAAREHLKEKDGQLKEYVVRCQDIEGGEHYLNADDLRYFSRESLAGNTTFSDNKVHRWLSKDMMYCFDNTYFEPIQKEEQKVFESFLRQSFNIKTFTNKSFFSDVVISNKKKIFETLTDRDILKEFIQYLKRDENDIFDGTLAFKTVEDMPILLYGNTGISKCNTPHLIQYDEAATVLYQKEWCPKDVFSVVDNLYSEFDKSTLLFLKIEVFELSNIMSVIIGSKGFPKNNIETQCNNIDFWQYVKSNIKQFDSLDSFCSLNFCTEGEDVRFLKGKELYIPDLYQKDGIETLVKKYDEKALFVSKQYLENDSENYKQEWLKLFKRLGLRYDNKDILFNSVLPHLSELEKDSVVSLMTKHLKDLKDAWEQHKVQLRKLKVRTRSGGFKTLDKTIIINIDEENVVEPFKNIELQGEIDPEILKNNKEIISLIANEFHVNCIYRSKQEWAQAKLNEYINSIQTDEVNRDNYHINFVRELASLISNDFTFDEYSLRKLLFISKDTEEGYLPSNKLTLGSEYKPNCDFESNGINELHYLSEKYLTSNNKDDIRAFFKKVINIHQSFELGDLPLLSNRTFALYFWGTYFPRRLAEFEEWIKGGRFNNISCIPTEGSVVPPKELYSPEIFHFARFTQNWESKVPSNSVVNGIKEENARKLFLTLAFKKKLGFEDCLNYLLNAKERLGDEYSNRRQIVEWILEDTNRDENLISWYREQANATWRNGKGQLSHIKDLYVIHIDARQERNIFNGDEHVMNTSMFPIKVLEFEEICKTLQLRCLKSSDFVTSPINPKDETVEIIKNIMPKILVIAAIEKPEKYQPLYEKYAETLKKYRFLVCDKIDLGYDTIHNDIERIYSDDVHIYYVNSWTHNRTYTKFCSKLKSLLGIDVYSDVCEDVLDNSNSVEDCIEKYCSSLVHDESFRNYLQELNHTINDFEEEYEIEENEEYYSDVVPEEEGQEIEVENDSNPDSECTTNQVEQSPTPNPDTTTTRQIQQTTHTSTTHQTDHSSISPDNDTTIAEGEDIFNEEKTGSDAMESSGTQIDNSKVISNPDVSSEIDSSHTNNPATSDDVIGDNDDDEQESFEDDDVIENEDDLIENEDDDEDDELAISANNGSLESERSIPSQPRDRSVRPRGAYKGKWEPAAQDSPSVRQRRSYSGYSPEKFKARQFNIGEQSPLTLSRREIGDDEVQYLSKLFGRALNVDTIKDENYIVRMRFYNSLKEHGLEMDMNERDYVEKGSNQVVTKSGKYIHRCSARSGILYISPTVWNRLREGRWIICFYSGKMADQFVYVRSQEELMQIINQDALVIQVTGNNKQEMVDRIYEDGFCEMDGNIYTLIRTIKVDGEVTPFDENITDYYSNDDDQDNTEL